MILGIDGGNTKIVAVVAADDGSVLGAARRDECADIYGASSPEAAIASTLATADDAIADAGVARGDLDCVGASVAGIDWPEDRSLLEGAMAAQGLGRRRVVTNDAFGALFAALPGGIGAAASCGTGLAVCARSPASSWHASFWLEWTEVGGRGGSGARILGALAIRAVLSGELGVGPTTALREATLRELDVDDPEELLHLLTSRATRGAIDTSRLVPALLQAAADADPVARGIVEQQGSFIGAQVAAAARRVGFSCPQLGVGLSGGVVGATGAEPLVRAIREAIREHYPAAEVMTTTVPPVLGAVLMALDACALPAGSEQRARLVATAPPASFYDTTPRCHRRAETGAS